MTGQILRFDASAHRAADALLPWFANGTLDGEELELVSRHLRECARCRREVEMLRQVQAFYALDAPATAPLRSSREVAALIAGGRRRDALVRWLRRLVEPWRRAPAWTRWAIAAEFAGLIGLAVLVAPPGDAPYRTLGASARVVAPGTIAVVFVPEIAEAELRRIVQAAGARIVDGPTASNAYLLRVPAGNRAEALAVMRSEPSVVLAEPLSATPDP